MDMTYALTFYRWFLKSIHLQLFLSLVSFPILLAWGIPISLASPAGNMLLGPFLTVFLFFSSLVFFTECVHIPNDWLVYALEKSTDLFMWCMHFGSRSWLVGFAKPSVIILIAIPACAVLIVQMRSLKKIYQSLVCLLLLHACIIVYLKCAFAVAPATPIACQTGSLSLICHEGVNTLIDPGYLGRRISCPNWARYQLTCQLIQMTGNTALENIVVLKINKTTCESLMQLCTELRVKNIYLPPWQTSLSAVDQTVFDQLVQHATQQSTRVVLLHHGLAINHAGTRLFANKLTTSLKWHETGYQAFQVRGNVAGNNIAHTPLDKKSINKDTHNPQ